MIVHINFMHLTYSVCGVLRYILKTTKNKFYKTKVLIYTTRFESDGQCLVRCGLVWGSVWKCVEVCGLVW